MGTGKLIGLESIGHYSRKSSFEAICESHYSEVYSLNAESLKEVVSGLVWMQILEKAREIENEYSLKIEKLQRFMKDISANRLSTTVH